LARTDHIRQALSSAREKDEPGNIEVEISEWVHANEKESVVANPGDTPDVSHRGHLERTDRSFHGFTSPNRKQGTVHSGEIGLHNKALLPFKLLTRFITLSVRQLFDDEIYVICLRILSVDKENF
jgi:hypothetical protein